MKRFQTLSTTDLIAFARMASHPESNPSAADNALLINELAKRLEQLLADVAEAKIS